VQGVNAQEKGVMNAGERVEWRNNFAAVRKSLKDKQTLQNTVEKVYEKRKGQHFSKAQWPPTDRGPSGKFRVAAQIASPLHSPT